MATTTTVKGTTIDIEDIAADWFLNNAAPNGLGTTGKWEDSGICVEYIVFIPTAANDILVILNSFDGDDTDPHLVYHKVADTTDSRIVYFNSRAKPIWPFIDLSACTFGSVGSGVPKVIFELR